MNSIQSPAQLQECIILATDPSNENSMRATAFLNNLCQESHDGASKICIDLLKVTLQQYASASKLMFMSANMNTTISVELQKEQQIYYNVIFYTLSTIQRALSTRDENFNASSISNANYSIVPYSSRLELRQIILHYILGIPVPISVPVSQQQLDGTVIDVDSTNKASPSLMLLPQYIRTKVGLVLSLIIQHDFPQRWPTAFSDTIHYIVKPITTTQFNNHGNSDTTTITHLNNNIPSKIQILTNIDIFLRMLHSFHDEVVDQTCLDRNTQIKDYMRTIIINDSNSMWSNTIAGTIIDAILTIFEWGYTTSFTDQKHQQKQKQFTTYCAFTETQNITISSLSVLKRFISWVDLSLFIHSRPFDIYFRCLSQTGPPMLDLDDSPYAKLAVQATECLKEIFARGMEDGKKVDLILDFKLFEKLVDCGLNVKTLDQAQINVVIKVAELIDSVGSELFIFWENKCMTVESTCSTESMELLVVVLQQLLSLFFDCFAYDDIDVSGAVIPLACRLTILLEKELEIGTSKEGQRFKISSYIHDLIRITYQQMRYPSDYEYDYEDEDDAEEEVYRTELRKLHQKIVKCCPELCLQFLCNALSHLPMPLSSAPTEEIEIALRLVYHYSEGIRPLPGVRTVMKNQTFRQVLIALHSSDIASHPHREVVILYYDVVVRYSQILKDNPELLLSILSSITSHNGLQHPHPRVRSRSCYLLLKLVKAMGQTLKPYVTTAVVGVQGLLENPALSLLPDDKCYLFETIGLLLGQTGIDASEQQRYITAVMSPHVQSIEHVVNMPNISRDPEYFGDILASSVAAISSLSKGFTKKPPSEVQLVLVETIQICLTVIRSLSSYFPIRSKVMIYLHRMILCLEEKVLLRMKEFVDILIETCDGQDILDVSQLLTQLCMKFKEKAIPIIDGTVIPFLRKCQSVAPLVTDADNETAPPPHVLTERIAIQKLVFIFLNQIATNECTPVFISRTNLSALDQIFQTMEEGAIVLNDPTIRKTCLQFFKALMDQWLVIDHFTQDIAAIQVRLLRYILDRFFPGMFTCMLSKTFDETDAMNHRVVKEVAVMISLLKGSRKSEFEKDLSSLMSENCSFELSNRFRTANTPEEILECLRAMLKSSKQ